MEKCIILLSTFNGKSFISEQLDSILSQEEADIKVVVRDDGSSDGTLRILSDYKDQNPDKFEIIPGQNIGWQKSFFYLISYAATHYADASYFAFADQDDIWLPSKIRMAEEALKPYQNIPALYCSNLFYYKDGQNLGPIHKAQPVITYKSALCRNNATGCTIVFNSTLLNLLKDNRPNFNVAHDLWCYSIAALCGTVVYDMQPHILYRQHNNNQIGNQRSFSDIWKRRFSHFNHPDFKNFRLRLAQQLIEKVGDKMPPNALQATLKIADYKKSFRNRLQLLMDSGYTFGNPINDLFIKLRIITGQL